MNTDMTVLRELADRYPDVVFDYVSDIWGADPCTITATDVIDLHQQLDWSDDEYAIKIACYPGDPVLVNRYTGDRILVLSTMEE